MRINFFNKYRLNIYLDKVEKRQGVNSLIYGTDRHILLWDFDESDLNYIKIDLEIMSDKYKLPTIQIFESSKNHYHAYCFCNRTFDEVIDILRDTKGVDSDYIRLGIARGYYTLRYSDRKYDTIRHVATIPSIFNNECSPLDVTTNEYLTTNMGVKNA